MTSFNVAGLLHEPPGGTRTARLRDHYLSLGAEVDLAGPLDMDVRFQRTNRGILVRGEASAPLRRICARCTDPYVEEVRVEIAEEFLPSVDPTTGAMVALQPEDDDATPRINGRHEIELTGILYDELLLTEPMHPLCSPDCPGLCVECGERRVGGMHAHEEAAADPRLAVLASLLADRDREDRA